MFERERRRRPTRRPPYDGLPEQGEGVPFGQASIPGHSPRSGAQGPDIDDYMVRSIMAMAGGAAPGLRTQGTPQPGRSEVEESSPDSLTLRIELPIARAEQLRILARDLDESPQTLARLWVMERLRDLAANRSAVSHSNVASQVAGVSQSIPGLPPAAPIPILTVADVKKLLGDSWITDPEERTVYDETYSFRQWGPYIASLVMSSRGRKVFTLEDMRVLLRDDLMPAVYDTPGALDSDLVIRDAELGRPGDQLRPFACLQRVSPGVYSFLGFGRARAMRSAR
jgi:hypothetical protein